MALEMDFKALDDIFDSKEEKKSEEAKKEEKPKAVKKTVVQSTENGANININVDQALLATTQSKITQMKVEMNNLFMERDDLVDIMMLALVSGTNLLMLGPPGTGKSKITQELCNRIDDANYFQWMLNKTSDPSEILGSFSVKEMENDRFMRVTDGKLPEAHIAFLDEVYKSNAPTLNALLTIMNEHIFYNDGVAVPVPLLSMIGASNEPPEDDSLMALHDRFILRMRLDYIRDAANRKRMAANYIVERKGFLQNQKTTVTLDEIQNIQNFTRTVTIDKNIINNFINLLNELNKSNINISDRRLNESLKIMQASAAIAGRNVVTLEDFASLVYVLWDKEADIPIIESAIAKKVNPYDDTFANIKRQFDEVKNGVDNETNDATKQKKAIEAKQQLDKIVSNLNKLIAEAKKNGRSIDAFSDFRSDVTSYSTHLINDVIGIGGGSSSTDDIF